MAQDLTSIAIFDPSSSNREMLRNVILGLDWILLTGESGQYNLSLLTGEVSELDGVLVALDEDPQRGLEFVMQIARDCPNLAIMVISNRPDVLVKAYRQGAKFLLDAPLQLEDLLGALRMFAAKGNPQRSTKGQIVAVLSSRGGVGSTSLAVNLGCTLALTPGNRVVLADLDLNLGAADIALGLVPEHNISEMGTQIERMDLRFLSNLLTPHETGLSLLARATQSHDIGSLHEEHVQRVLRLLQLTSTHVLVDLSKGWLTTDLQALIMADVILLVLQPDLASVRNAMLILTSLAADSLDTKVLIVMNRTGAYFGRDGIDVKKAEEALGRLVYWQIPNDYQAFTDSWNAGVPLIRMAPKCRGQQAIAGLMDALGRRLSPTQAEKSTKAAKTTIIHLGKV